MKRKFNDLFWAGALLMLLIAAFVVSLTWGVTTYVKGGVLTDAEIVYDTIIKEVEVIKEVHVECTLPHVQPKTTTIQKPVETVEKSEPKDSIL